MRVPRSGTRISHMCMRAARAMLGKARAPGPDRPLEGQITLGFTFQGYIQI